MLDFQATLYIHTIQVLHLHCVECFAFHPPGCTKKNRGYNMPYHLPPASKCSIENSGITICKLEIEFTLNSVHHTFYILKCRVQIQLLPLNTAYAAERETYTATLNSPHVRATVYENVFATPLIAICSVDCLRINLWKMKMVMVMEMAMAMVMATQPLQYVVLN